MRVVTKLGWHPLYVVLVALRFIIAVQKSYVHPDEQYQSLQYLARRILHWRVDLPWEFTSPWPIRSIVPLYFQNGWPFALARCFPDAITPLHIFYVQRTWMALLSLGNDFIIYRITPAQARPRALCLFAGSWFTLSLLTHTFTNSLETLLVSLAVFLLEKCRKGSATCAVAAGLGAVVALGVFTRITFAAFLFVPFIVSLHNILQRPLLGFVIGATFVAVSAALVFADARTYLTPLTHAVTPLNNVAYNSQTTNLAQHGRHPLVLHVLVNLPLLLGPLVLCVAPNARLATLAAAGGIGILSLVPHQELRFLLPAATLLMPSVAVGNANRRRRVITCWIVYSAACTLFFGVLHQNGVVPAMDHVRQLQTSCLARGSNGISTVFAYKTYNPPSWLWGDVAGSMKLQHLVGLDAQGLDEALMGKAGPYCDGGTLVVGPRSMRLGTYAAKHMRLLWRTHSHVNLDDMDFAQDGLLDTILRIVGRPGYGIWAIE